MGNSKGFLLYERGRRTTERTVESDTWHEKVYIYDGVAFKYTKRENGIKTVWKMELASEDDLQIPKDYTVKIDEYEYFLYTCSDEANRVGINEEALFKQPIAHIIKAVDIIKHGDKDKILELVRRFDADSYGEFISYGDHDDADKKQYSYEVFKFLGEELQSDIPFIMSLLSIKPQIYEYLSCDVQKNKEVLKLMLENRALFDAVIQNIRELDDYKSFILDNLCNPIRYFPEFRTDEDFIKEYKLAHKDDRRIAELDFSKPTLWVCPINDLESFTISQMIMECAVYDENIRIITMKTGSNVSWDSLDDSIKEQINEAKSLGYNIYGIELKGDCEGAVNIDHHTYNGKDRENEKSSIEQVADILGIDLTVDEKFVSANDKGYIPAMERLAKELGISDEDFYVISKYVRSRDRKLQGITMFQEEQAFGAEKWLNEVKHKLKYAEVKLSGSVPISIIDMLYKNYDNILVICNDGTTTFYGETEIIEEIIKEFNCGNTDGQLNEGTGFWKGRVNQGKIRQFMYEKFEGKVKKDNLDAKEELRSNNDFIDL